MRKRKNLWLMVSLLAGALVMNACSSSDDPEPTPGPGPNPTPAGGISDGTKVNPANMKMSALSGFVFDTNGNALKGVSVTSGTEACATGPDGGFVLEKVNSVGGRTVVKFSCSGYFDVIRSMKTKAGDVWEVTMIPSWGSDKTANSYGRSSDAISVTAAGMTVDLQPDGLKFADTGEPLNSFDWANIDILYLSPDDENFATMMPGGDLAAVRSDKSEVQLISYGMTSVNLNANGRKLQPADGKPATVTFPVPARFTNNTPDQIPLWSFNEGTGLWEEEGVATYDSDRNVYVGQVTHFSWVNLDYPESRATVKVTVKDQAGNIIPNQLLDVDGQRSYTTDSQGVAEFYVPTNTQFYITVHSRDYSYYSPEVTVNVDAIPTAGSTKNVDLVLPTLAHISGKVVNTGKGNSLSSLWIEYGSNKATKSVHTDAQGQFILNAPYGYTGAAKLVLLASDGSKQAFDITLDGQDHAYTLSIKTDKSTGGIITFTPYGGAARSIIVEPMFASDFMGVEIVDGNMSVSTNSLSLGIPSYSESKSSYSNAYINVWTSDVSFRNEAASATVTKNEYNNYTFKVSGTAQSETWQDGTPKVNNIGTFSGEFSAPLLGTGKTLKPIDRKESFFPSFTPWIDAKKPYIGLQLTETVSYGTGVLLWYFDKELNYNDYKAFKAQAQSALGNPVECFDAENGGSDTDMSVAYFYKDGKYIMVSYCPWRDVEEEDLEMTMTFWALRENHAARIQVHALEGLTSAPEDLMIIHGR